MTTTPGCALRRNINCPAVARSRQRGSYGSRAAADRTASATERSIGSALGSKQLGSVPAAKVSLGALEVPNQRLQLGMAKERRTAVAIRVKDAASTTRARCRHFG